YQLFFLLGGLLLWVFLYLAFFKFFLASGWYGILMLFIDALGGGLFFKVSYQRPPPNPKNRKPGKNTGL
ncbi:hypothetical protein ACQWKP_23035, partial [Salmonella enterica subsp. enterica serovar Infantis]